MASQAENREFGVVILGASEFPNYPPEEGLSQDSFRKSAAAIGRIFGNGGVLASRSHILDLFNDDGQPNQQIDKIGRFLHERSSLTDVIIYYCGHGHLLLDRAQTVVFLLRNTIQHKEAGMALRLDALTLMLSSELGSRRLYAILDGCYSGKALDQLQGSADSVANNTIDSAFSAGTAVLSASSRDTAARTVKDEPMTMFTGSLIDLLDRGLDQPRELLSLLDIKQPLTASIQGKYKHLAVTPMLHAPSGDIETRALFINRAFESPTRRPATTEERKHIDKAKQRLDDADVPIRLVGVESLGTLLKTTTSDGVRREIVALLDEAKGNDSDRVKAAARKVLEDFNRPPPPPPPDPGLGKLNTAIADLANKRPATRKSAIEALAVLHREMPYDAKIRIETALRELGKVEKHGDVRKTLQAVFPAGIAATGPTKEKATVADEGMPIWLRIIFVLMVVGGLLFLFGPR